MLARVRAVKPGLDYTLVLHFTNGEVKIFDVKPYLDRGIFRELKDRCYFEQVRPFLGSIQWPHGQDFCPDTLYLESEPVTSETPVSVLYDEASDDGGADDWAAQLEALSVSP